MVYGKTGAESDKTPCEIKSSLVYSKLKKLNYLIFRRINNPV